jgi:hypothetical protein
VKRAAAIGLALAAPLLAAAAHSAQQGSPPTAPPDRRVDLDFLRYYTAEQLQVALQSLASAYPELVSLESIGQSRGGRELWVATLTSREGREPGRKSAMLIAGSLSERDPHGAEMALFTLFELAQNHARDPQVAEALASCTLYFAPSLDPDARARLLEPPANGSEPARTVAIDRNFPAGWSPWEGGVGGAYPLSEPESRALSDFLTAHPNVALVQTYSVAAGEVQAAEASAMPPPDQALHDSVLERAQAELDEPDSLRSAAGDALRGGSLLAHVVLERGALGFQSVVAGRVEGRLPQVQELFPLARRASAHSLLLARSLPRLAIGEASVTRLRSELWQVDVEVENRGLVATAGELAQARRLTLPPRLQISGAGSSPRPSRSPERASCALPRASPARCRCRRSPAASACACAWSSPRRARRSSRCWSRRRAQARPRAARICASARSRAGIEQP